MLEGEFDASSGCLEGPLSVIIEAVELQAAGCGVQGKFKCSSGAEQFVTWQAVAHSSVVRDELGRAAAIAEMPLVSDTNLPEPS